jgi:ketosteroid isomerase-like protein
MFKKSRGFGCRRWAACFAAAILIFTLSFDTQAGQKKKKTKDTDKDASTQPLPGMPMPESDKINNDIGEMLAAFQLGKVDMMHKYYSDNVTFVSGEYAPPVIGWQNYVPMYERQWAAFQGIQLNRRNTLVFIHGDVAWASYQWQFDALLKGQPYSMRGQTTLIFNKVGDDWLIVHNHTSQIYSPPAYAQSPPPAAAPQPQQGAVPTASPKP